MVSDESHHIKQHLAVFICLSALAVIYVWVYHWSTQDRIEFCYSANYDHGANSRLYWDTGSGFNEKNAIGRRISHSGYSKNCFTIRKINSIKRIRLDPMARPGTVEINDLSISVDTGLIAQITGLSSFLGDKILLHVDSIAKRNQFITSFKNDNYFVSTGYDPYLVWNAKLTTDNMLLYELEVITILLILLVASLNYNDNAATIFTKYYMRTNISYLLIFPLFLFVGYLSQAFINLYPLINVLLFIGFLLFLFNVWVEKILLIRTNASVFVLGLSFITMTTYISLYMHLSNSGAYVFSLDKKMMNYNWSIGKASNAILSQSGIRYQSDVDKLQNLLTPGVMFLSDRATNYYLSAMLPLYGANPHPHNRPNISPYITQQTLAQICSNDFRLKGWYAMVDKSSYNIKRNWPEIKYLIINRDIENNNVRNSCLTTHVNEIENDSRLNLHLVFSGIYLDVFLVGAH